MSDENEVYLNIKQVIEYAHIGRPAIYAAMKKGRLVGKKFGTKWMISRQEIDRYRLNKYNRDSRVISGKPIFSIEEGRFSVNQAAKILSFELNCAFPMQRVYYLIRTGQLAASRVGTTFVIKRKDILDLIQKEKHIKNLDYRQIKLA